MSTSIGRARIEPARNYDHETAGVLAKTLRSESGDPFAVFTTLARHPRLLKRFNVLGGLFMAHGELDPRERELVVLRVAWRTGCSYEWGQHVGLGRKAGITDDELVWLCQPSTTTGWATQDAGLLVATDQLLEQGDLDDAAWASISNGHSDAQVLELLMLIGFYRMLAGVLRAVRVELDAGLPGWPVPAEAVTT